MAVPFGQNFPKLRLLRWSRILLLQRLLLGGSDVQGVKLQLSAGNGGVDSWSQFWSYFNFFGPEPVTLSLSVKRIESGPKRPGFRLEVRENGYSFCRYNYEIDDANCFNTLYDGFSDFKRAVEHSMSRNEGYDIEASFKVETTAPADSWLFLNDWVIKKQQCGQFQKGRTLRSSDVLWRLYWESLAGVFEGGVLGDVPANAHVGARAAPPPVAPTSETSDSLVCDVLLSVEKISQPSAGKLPGLTLWRATFKAETKTLPPLGVHGNSAPFNFEVRYTRYSLLSELKVQAEKFMKERVGGKVQVHLLIDQRQKRGYTSLDQWLNEEFPERQPECLNDVFERLIHSTEEAAENAEGEEIRESQSDNGFAKGREGDFCSFCNLCQFHSYVYDSAFSSAPVKKSNVPDAAHDNFNVPKCISLTVKNFEDVEKYYVYIHIDGDSEASHDEKLEYSKTEEGFEEKTIWDLIDDVRRVEREKGPRDSDDVDHAKKRAIEVPKAGASQHTVRIEPDDTRANSNFGNVHQGLGDILWMFSKYISLKVTVEEENPTTSLSYVVEVYIDGNHCSYIKYSEKEEGFEQKTVKDLIHEVRRKETEKDGADGRQRAIQVMAPDGVFWLESDGEPNKRPEDKLKDALYAWRRQ